MKKQILILITGSLIAGCSVESPDRYPVAPPPVADRQKHIQVTEIQEQWGKYEAPPVAADPTRLDAVAITSNGFEAEFNPQVDILFVIDNSESMVDDQAKLIANIDKFVKAFDNYQLVDFHIGVTSVWDSVRFINDASETAGPRKFAKDFKIGQLRPFNGHPFVTKGMGINELSAALKIGVEKWADGGPEFEEIFSVIESAVTTRKEVENKGFIRPDAQLVVIILTDADDSSPNTNLSKTARVLWDVKGNKNKVSTYGVLSGDGCEKDPMLKATKDQSEKKPVILKQFLENTRNMMTANNEFNLCDPNYGSRLAEIGKDIVAKTLTKEVKIDGMKFEVNPQDLKRISVFYGSQEVKMDSATGWTYNPVANSFLINGKKFKPEPNAKITIKVTPLNQPSEG